MDLSPLPPSLPELLTKRELAKYFGCSTQTIDRMDREGRIPAAIRFGGRKRWVVDEVVRWIHAQKQFQHLSKGQDYES